MPTEATPPATLAAGVDVPALLHTNAIPITTAFDVTVFDGSCSAEVESGCFAQLAAAVAAGGAFALATGLLAAAIIDGVPGDELAVLEIQAGIAALAFAAAEAALTACLE